MRLVFIALISILTLSSPLSALAGDKTGNGGDEIALELQAGIAKGIEAIASMTGALPANVDAEKLKAALKSVKILVVDDPLIVNFEGAVQESVAINLPLLNLIKVNRKRWKQISELRTKVAIALHEFLSLQEIESTGSYPISSLYLRRQGANLKDNNLHNPTYCGSENYCLVKEPQCFSDGSSGLLLLGVRKYTKVCVAADASLITYQRMDNSGTMLEAWWKDLPETRAKCEESIKKFSYAESCVK